VASESSNQAAESQQGEQQGQEDQQNRQADGQSRQDRRQQAYDYDEIKDNAPVRKNDPRTSVQKTEEYRFANNIPGDQTIPRRRTRTTSWSTTTTTP
jgi:hypothetical protein